MNKDKILTISDAITRTGRSHKELATLLRLPHSVMTKLVRGEIMGASIPNVLTKMLSEHLGQPENWLIERYPVSIVNAYCNCDCKQTRFQRTASWTLHDAVLEAHDGTEDHQKFWLENW